MSQLSQSTKIKVYLQSETGWQDYAVGYLQIVQEEGHGFLRVIQLNEPLSLKLVTHPHQNVAKEPWCINLKIGQDIHYDKQGESIIVWNEPELHEEIAVSFLDSSYCRETFMQILTLSGRKGHQHFRFDEEEINDILPSHQNLDAVQSYVNDHGDSVIWMITNKHAYLDGLKKTFDEAEEQQQEHVLEQLYWLLRSLIYLKNEGVMKELLSDRYYMLTFGIMEYHIDNRGTKKVSYRQFLSQNLNFSPLLQLSEDVLQKIHFNYRLTYLKESVMAYYLFSEDTTYNMFSQIISGNNQFILEQLLTKHLDQFNGFLRNFKENLLQSCKFINEFYMTFRQFLQIQDISNLFFNSIKNTQFLMNLQRCIEQAMREFSAQDAQFICYTLLQFQSMIISGDLQLFAEFLLENAEQQQLFWGNLQNLVFSGHVTTHGILIDLIAYMYPPAGPSNSLLALIHSQLLTWLKKCIMQPLTNGVSVSALQQILQTLCQHKATVNKDLLQLSAPILDLILKAGNKGVQQKLILMPALKHLKYLIQSTQPDVHRFLVPYLEQIHLVHFNTHQEGIIEGQLRDIIKAIQTSKEIGSHMCQHLQKQPKYSPLFQCIVDTFIGVPISRPLNMEEEKYFDADEPQQCEQQQQQQENPIDDEQQQLLLEKLIAIQRRKQHEDNDEEDIMNPSNKNANTTNNKGIAMQIVFSDNIMKKVKQE